MSISEKFHIFQKKAEGLVMCKDYSAAKETYSDCICQLKMELETVQECQHVKLHELLSVAYNDRGLVKYFKVDFYGAMDDYSRALEFNPQLTAAYYNRGLIHYRLGNFADAIEDMNSALAIDPCFASAEECKRQAEIDTCDKLDAIQQTGCKACA